MTDTTTDQTFCAAQIWVPPTLPSILKKYAKAAIRTQPFDLLVWSAAYFKAMASGEVPPVKNRLEYPPIEMFSLSFGYIKLLLRQLGKQGSISRESLQEKWSGVCLPNEKLFEIFKLGHFGETVDIQKFIAIAVGLLEKTLKQTMIRICEIMTEEPDGGSAMIDVQLFVLLYRFLAEMDCGVVNPFPSKEQPVTFEIELKPVQEKIEEEEVTPSPEWDAVMQEINKEESFISIETPKERVHPTLEWPDLDAIDCEMKITSEIEEEDDEDMSDHVVDVFEIGEHYEGMEIEHDESASRFELKEYNPELSHHTNITTEVRDPHELSASELEELEVISLPSSEKILIKSQKQRSESSMKLKVFDKTQVFDTFGNASEVTILKIAAECSPRSCENSEVSDGSDSYLFTDLIYSDDVSSDKVLRQSTSVDELRFTQNAETRKAILLAGLMAEEERRRQEQLRLEREAIEARIKAEADAEFWMWVPGIGAKLPEEMISDVEAYVLCCARGQAGVIMPRNLRHFSCPPLDFESLEMKTSIDMVLKSDEKSMRQISTMSAKFVTEDQVKHAKSQEVLFESWNYDPSNLNSEMENYSTVSLLTEPSVGDRLNNKMSFDDILLTCNEDRMHDILKTQLSPRSSEVSIQKKFLDKKLKEGDEKKAEEEVPVKPQDWVLSHWKEEEGKELPDEELRFLNSKEETESKVNTDMDEDSFNSQKSLFSPSVTSIGSKLQPKLKLDEILVTLNENSMKRMLKKV